MHSLKYLVVLSFTSSVFGSFVEYRAVCNANNCLRAIIGSKPRTSDCASFLLHTVSAGSTISPSSIPPYASPCSGTAAYSSACSCAGVIGSTTTIVGPTTSTISPTGPTTSITSPTSTITSGSPSTCPTITLSIITTTITVISTYTPAVPTSYITEDITLPGVTSYVTITDDITLPASTITDIIPTDVETLTTITTDIISTSIATVTVQLPPSTVTVYCAAALTCNPGGAQPTFALLAEGSGTSVDGESAYIDVTDEDVYFAPSSPGTLFTFTDACALITVDSQQEGIIITGADPDPIWQFFTPSDASYFGDAPAVCNIVDGELACSGGGYSILTLCEQGILSLGRTIESGCYPVTLIPQYVC